MPGPLTFLDLEPGSSEGPGTGLGVGGATCASAPSAQQPAKPASLRSSGPRTCDQGRGSAHSRNLVRPGGASARQQTSSGPCPWPWTGWESFCLLGWHTPWGQPGLSWEFAARMWTGAPCCIRSSCRPFLQKRHCPPCSQVVQVGPGMCISNK